MIVCDIGKKLRTNHGSISDLVDHFHGVIHDEQSYFIHLLGDQSYQHEVLQSRQNIYVEAYHRQRYIL